MSNRLGNLYLNQNKDIFSVCINIILEEVARNVLHFQTPNTLNHFFKCSNSQKSYQTLTQSFQLQVCLSICDLLVDIRHERVKSINL